MYLIFIIIFITIVHGHTFRLQPQRTIHQLTQSFFEFVLNSLSHKFTQILH